MSAGISSGCGCFLNPFFSWTRTALTESPPLLPTNKADLGSPPPPSPTAQRRRASTEGGQDNGRTGSFRDRFSCPCLDLDFPSSLPLGAWSGSTVQHHVRRRADPMPSLLFVGIAHHYKNVRPSWGGPRRQVKSPPKAEHFFRILLLLSVVLPPSDDLDVATLPAPLPAVLLGGRCWAVRVCGCLAVAGSSRTSNAWSDGVRRGDPSQVRGRSEQPVVRPTRKRGAEEGKVPDFNHRGAIAARGASLLLHPPHSSPKKKQERRDESGAAFTVVACRVTTRLPSSSTSLPVRRKGPTILLEREEEEEEAPGNKSTGGRTHGPPEQLRSGTYRRQAGRLREQARQCSRPAEDSRARERERESAGRPGLKIALSNASGKGLARLGGGGGAHTHTHTQENVEARMSDR